MKPDRNELSSGRGDAKVGEEDTLVAERRGKLSRLRQAGWNYPNRFQRRDCASEIHRSFGDREPEGLKSEGVEVAIAGRIVHKRIMGKAAFLVLLDGTGRMQVYLKLSVVGEELFEECKAWDLGDIVGTNGSLFFTKTGELTVNSTGATLLSKSLRPLPGKYHGLADRETRYRQRYLSLMTDEAAQDVFRLRFRLISLLRDFFTGLGFLEVETPMMHPIPGGAAAKPFVTHHNTLDRDLYLRIAPELYLKRLVVGGFEKVFEINRNFRNEGISPQHNPEFTMLEYYMAYGHCETAIELTERLMREVVPALLGGSSFSYQGVRMDVMKSFDRVTPAEALVRHAGLTEAQVENHDFLVGRLGGIEGEKARKALADEDIGVLQYRLFEKQAEAGLQQPTFVVDLPSAVSPLSRRRDDAPEFSERFELYMGGFEIANGFSELNDPEVQAKVFQEQAERLAQGDEEAMWYDEDYVRALEYGMPPAVGEGIGVDRLAMLLTDSASIRDVILFPMMRDRKRRRNR